MCFDFLYNSVILRGIRRDIKNAHTYSYKNTSKYFQVTTKLGIFSTYYRKIRQILNFTKFVQWKPSFFHADGKTHRVDLTVFFFFEILQTRVKVTLNRNFFFRNRNKNKFIQSFFLISIFQKRSDNYSLH